MLSNFEQRRKEIEDYFKKEKEAELRRIEQERQSQEHKSREESERLDRDFAARGNDLAVQYERNRRSFNNFAAARGLGSGSASQAELAGNSRYLREFGAHAARRSEARQRGIAELKEISESFERKAAETSADSDRRKMSTLLSEKDKHLQRLISQASTLSQFGDFSLYKEIYGPEKAAELERAWCAKNPELALSMGKITPEQFQAFTGRGLYGGNIVQNRNSRWGKRRKKYYGKESSVSSYVDTRHQGDSHRLIMDR